MASRGRSSSRTEWKRTRWTRTTTPLRCHQTWPRRSSNGFTSSSPAKRRRKSSPKPRSLENKVCSLKASSRQSHAMLEESKKRKDDERVIASLQGVLNFLVQLYQKYNAPPTLGVIDNIVREWQIMAEKGETTDEKMKEVVRRVAKEGNVELAELAGAVDGFKASMDEQDAQFELQEAELRSRPEGVAPKWRKS